jgi:hypothetical protein
MAREFTAIAADDPDRVMSFREWRERYGFSPATGRRILAGPNSRDDDPDRVMSFAEWCKRSGFSLATGRRILAGPNSPVVTYLSARRIGIRNRHHVDWLDRCAKTATTTADIAAKRTSR